MRDCETEHAWFKRQSGWYQGNSNSCSDNYDRYREIYTNLCRTALHQKLYILHARRRCEWACMWINERVMSDKMRMSCGRWVRVTTDTENLDRECVKDSDIRSLTMLPASSHRHSGKSRHLDRKGWTYPPIGCDSIKRTKHTSAL